MSLMTADRPSRHRRELGWREKDLEKRASTPQLQEAHDAKGSVGLAGSADIHAHWTGGRARRVRRGGCVAPCDRTNASVEAKKRVEAKFSLGHTARK